MWLYWVSAVFLCAQSSSALLAEDSLPSRNRRSDDSMYGDDEGTADDYLIAIQIDEILGKIKTQLDAFRNHTSSKMDKLEAACKNKPAAKTPPSFEYGEPTGDFKNARMNTLVNIITEKMNVVAEIFMDDLMSLTQNFSATVSESLEARFPPAESDFSDLHSLIEGLAKKEAVNQIKTNIESFVTSSIAEVREHVKTMASKPELVTVTNDLVSRAKHLQEATESMEVCAESTELVKDALPKATESARKIADAKAKWLSSAASTCPNVPGRLLSSLDSAAKERRDSVERLSQTLTEMEDGVSTNLEELTLILKVAKQLQGTKTSPPPPTSPPTILQPTTEPFTTGRPYEPECLDSTFKSSLSVSFSAPDICDSAVRLQNCHSEFVSFHCCRTCRRSGYVYPVPNIGASRQVPLLEALRSVMPSLSGLQSPQSSSLFPQQYSQILSSVYPSVKG